MDDKLFDPYGDKRYEYKDLTFDNCARCGQRHVHRFWRFVGNKPVDSDGTVWGWWGLCQITGDPVFMREIPGEETKQGDLPNAIQ